jgi:hypothetical protein
MQEQGKLTEATQEETLNHQLETEEVKVPTLADEYTQEEINGLIAGVRPAGMEYERFKVLRTAIKRGIKGLMKGKYFFVSSRLVSAEDGKVYKETMSYRKEKK